IPAISRFSASRAAAGRSACCSRCRTHAGCFTALSQHLGLSRNSLETLQTLPVAQLIAAITPTKQKVGRPALPLLDRYDFGPVVDGSDLPQQPCDPVPTAFSDDIPLLIGD